MDQDTGRRFKKRSKNRRVVRTNINGVSISNSDIGKNDLKITAHLLNIKEPSNLE